MLNGVQSPMTCDGYRCLDRDACFRFDAASAIVRKAHDGGDCEAESWSERQTLAYITRSGKLTRISIEEAEQLMQCSYVRKLVFQQSTVLRNYAFWGFGEHKSGGFDALSHKPERDDHSVSSSVAIGHVASLEDVERNALGLFATAAIECGDLIGEYTGIVQVDWRGAHAAHDPYGMCYPSVFEGGQLFLSALEYGNEIRCINHSYEPNVRFKPLIYDGILHVFCLATRAITAGEQLLVNYGPTYWQTAGIEPLGNC